MVRAVISETGTSTLQWKALALALVGSSLVPDTSKTPLSEEGQRMLAQKLLATSESRIVERALLQAVIETNFKSREGTEQVFDNMKDHISGLRQFLDQLETHQSDNDKWMRKHEVPRASWVLMNRFLHFLLPPNIVEIIIGIAEKSPGILREYDLSVIRDDKQWWTEQTKITTKPTPPKSKRQEQQQQQQSKRQQQQQDILIPQKLYTTKLPVDQKAKFHCSNLNNIYRFLMAVPTSDFFPQEHQLAIRSFLYFYPYAKAVSGPRLLSPADLEKLQSELEKLESKLQEYQWSELEDFSTVNSFKDMIRARFHEYEIGEGARIEPFDPKAALLARLAVALIVDKVDFGSDLTSYSKADAEILSHLQTTVRNFHGKFHNIRETVKASPETCCSPFQEWMIRKPKFKSPSGWLTFHHRLALNALDDSSQYGGISELDVVIGGLTITNNFYQPAVAGGATSAVGGTNRPSLMETVTSTDLLELQNKVENLVREKGQEPSKK